MTATEIKRAMQAKWLATSRAKRKVDGKCHDCNGKRMPGAVRCEACHERNRQRTRGYDRRRLVNAWRPIDHALGTDE